MPTLIIDKQVTIGKHFFRKTERGASTMVIVPFDPIGLERMRRNVRGDVREMFQNETEWVFEQTKMNGASMTRARHVFMNTLPDFALDSFESRNVAVVRHFMEKGSSLENNSYVDYMRSCVGTIANIMSQLGMKNLSDVEGLHKKIVSSSLDMNFIVDNFLSLVGLELVGQNIIVKYPLANEEDRSHYIECDLSL